MTLLLVPILLFDGTKHVLPLFLVLCVQPFNTWRKSIVRSSYWGEVTHVGAGRHDVFYKLRKVSISQ